MTDILDNKYKILTNNYIGKGGFGVVYKGYDLINNKNVAIKLDDKKKYNKREYNVYSKFLGNKDMPQFIDFIEKEEKSYLIMTLYSKDASVILKMNREKYFNEKDILMLGIQIIQQLGHLHKLGIIHRDIKPDNFIYDLNTNKFKLIDFGLCKPYTSNKIHVKEKYNIGRCGTMRYMSTNSHNKTTLSRRDDLISLSYSLIYLYCKKLPWQGLKNNKRNVHKIISAKKDDFTNEINKYNLIEPLVYLYNYSVNLKFDSRPDYSFLIKYFYKYLKSRNFKYNGKWTWYKKI
jgi:casein kinase I homolog HRR25